MLSWFKLKNFPRQIFKNESIISDRDYLNSLLKDGTNPMIMLNKDDFSDIMNDWFARRGLMIEKSMMFYRFEDAEPHIDLKAKSTVASIQHNYGINIEFFGKGTMSWYKTPKLEEKDIIKTVAGTPFVRFKKENIEEIDCLYNVRDPVLVRTDIPHSVEMIKGPRLVVSIRFREIGQDDACSWENILSILKEDLQSRYDYNLTIPGMTRPFELSALGYISSLVLPGKIFIEVGSWIGRSSYAISKNLPPKSVLHCIDTWEYNNDYGNNLLDISKQHTKSNFNDYYISHKGMELLIERYQTSKDWLDIWKQYTSDCNNIVPFKMRSEDYDIPGNVACVYIDGNHSAEGVSADLKKFNISNDVLLCGDDCSMKHINGVVYALLDGEVREKTLGGGRTIRRTLIVLPNSKFWILLPTEGYWANVFKLGDILKLS